jgi:GT2 family glycosyltransferase
MINVPTLAIILVNWNGSADTVRCLNSIRSSVFTDYVTIVVDNGSSAEQLASLQKCEVDFVLIETGENLGYTGGNNVGIRYAQEHEINYVLLLNNDTIIESSALTNLITSADAEPNVGIFSPKILFYPQSTLIWSAGTYLNRWLLMGYLTGYKEEDKGQFNQAQELDYVTGCAMLIRRSVINDIGMLSDDYFAVCEDLDFCLRAQEAGYRVKYIPSATVWHVESASSGGVDAPQYVYYQTRNYFLFHNQWSKGLLQLFSSNSFYLICLIKRSFVFLMHGKWKSIIGIIYGIRDVLIGKLGRRDYAILARSK